MMLHMNRDPHCSLALLSFEQGADQGIIIALYAWPVSCNATFQVCVLLVHSTSFPPSYLPAYNDVGYEQWLVLLPVMAGAFTCDLVNRVLP